MNVRVGNGSFGSYETHIGARFSRKVALGGERNTGSF
jgi:hypothetical protein